MTAFAERLTRAIREHGPLCVGIDPSAALLKSCGLPDSADGALAFGERVLQAAEFKLAIIKPQSAFFERFGSAGVGALERLTVLAREQGVLVLLDGKRGDIDTTGAAYAESFFGTHAQLIVGAGFRDAATLAATSSNDLCAAVLAYATSSEGQRVLRDGDAPDIEAIVAWGAAAKEARAA